ncbi:MAG: hypothetical protein ABS903_11020 [Solibacillus sp.]
MYDIWQGDKKEYVTVSLIGDQLFKGIIFDSGSDIIVLFNGENFIYIPVSHIEYIVAETPDTEFAVPSDSPIIPLDINKKNLTFESILKEAKGINQEICIINKKYLFGTVLEVMDDYLVFFSPVYKRTYIPINHIKWLIPYTPNERPYGLSEAEFSWKQADEGFEANFEKQLAVLLNKLIVLNMGEKTHHIGKVKSINGKMLELKTAKEKRTYVNIEHIQTIHCI